VNSTIQLSAQEAARTIVLDGLGLGADRDVSRVGAARVRCSRPPSTLTQVTSEAEVGSSPATARRIQCDAA
jgi:hypothetical protein